jgi:CheY-like chemotaxis protein
LGNQKSTPRLVAEIFFTIAVSKPLILCLEDNPTYLALRKKVLEREGYEVIGVKTAGEAVKALREFPICVEIADHLLQKTTGGTARKGNEDNKARGSGHLVFGHGSGTLRWSGYLPNKSEPAAKFLDIVRAVVERGH